MIELPRVPSALIRLALKDLAECEADPHYEINMNTWHTYSANKCSVCFAGAVIAMSLQRSRDATLSLGLGLGRDLGLVLGYGQDNASALNALDALRLGRVVEAFDDLRIDPNACHVAEELDRDIVPYDEDPAAFRAEMSALADDLEAIGH